MSPLGQALADYLRVRRALGFRLDRAERLLAQFVAYLHDHNAEVLTIDQALAWATSPADATPRWWAHRLSTVRGFAAYLHALDARVEVPPPGLLRSGPRRQTPYLYSQADIAALVDAAGTLPRPLGAATYQTLIGLLAVTGMRVGEAIRLDRDDLDADHDGLLTVRHSKFGKSRLVPLHPAGQPRAVAVHRRHPAWLQQRLAHLPPPGPPGRPQRPFTILPAQDPRLCRPPRYADLGSEVLVDRGDRQRPCRHNHRPSRKARRGSGGR